MYSSITYYNITYCSIAYCRIKYCSFGYCVLLLLVRSLRFCKHLKRVVHYIVSQLLYPCLYKWLICWQLLRSCAALGLVYHTLESYSFQEMCNLAIIHLQQWCQLRPQLPSHWDPEKKKKEKKKSKNPCCTIHEIEREATIPGTVHSTITISMMYCIRTSRCAP